MNHHSDIPVKMKKTTFLLCSLVVSLTVCQAQNFVKIDEDAAIQLSSGWENDPDLVAFPLVHVSENSRAGAALSIVKEVPAEVEVDTLNDYTALKIELLSDTYPEFKPAPPKEGEVNGLAANYFEGKAVIADPQGIKIDSDLVLMTIQGKSHFYLVFGLLRKGSSAAAKADLIKVIRTFQERPQD